MYECAFCIIQFFLPMLVLTFIIERFPAAREFVDRLADRIGLGDEPEWMR